MKIPFRQYWQLLSQYLKPQWARALLLGVLLLSGIGLQLLNPQIMRYFIDTAVAGGAWQSLMNAALIFFGVALLNQGLSVLNTYFGEYVAWSATNALRLDLLLHCLKLDQSFHHGHTAGELLERIDGDVNALSNFFSRLTVGMLGNILLLLGVLLLLFREDWRVGVSLSFFALLALFMMVRIRQIAIVYWKEGREIIAKVYGFLGEQLTATEDIRANGARGYAIRGFDLMMQKWYPLRRKAILAFTALSGTNIALFALANALAFGLSAYLWYQNMITIGSVYLIFYYTELLRNPMTQIRDQMESLQQAEASIERIKTLFATEPKLKDGAGVPLPTGSLSVSLKDVSFGYDEEERVLHDISFELAPGRVLGLLGRTGSGKTTMARLLLRLYDPDQGEICLSGVSLRDAHLNEIRQRVSLVTQEVQLFKATIRENLTFFNPAIRDEQIEEVLAELGLGTWLASQPKGLDTMVEAGGSNLSAGQAQLLAFGRVFLSNPGLVILDEASSRLDPATEQLIERAVSKLLSNRSAIIIAHHLPTVERADDILILEDGHIVEYGARRQLAQDSTSRFYQLLQSGLEEVLA
ncbi:MAG: ABC transporter ATP-binding protein [Ardenticatenaceae bacterium]